MEVVLNNLEIINDEENKEVKKDIFEDKITSAKILQSTKDMIETFNIKGNQQEKLDTLVKNYKKFLDEAHNNAKLDTVDLNLSNEFNNFSKELDVFIKKIELKVNKHLEDTIRINNSNLEKELNTKHNNFIKCLEEVKHSGDKNLLKENETLSNKNEELERENRKLLIQIEELNQKVQVNKIKYEEERDVKNTLLENLNHLKKEIPNSNEILEKNNEIAELKRKLSEVNSHNSLLSNTLNNINNSISSLTKEKLQAIEEKNIAKNKLRALEEEIKTLKNFKQ